MAAGATTVGTVERFHEVALLGMLASGYFALAGSLDWATAALTLAALVARVLMLAGVLQWSVSAKYAAMLGFACLLFYPIDERFLSHSFLISTVHLVCFLAVIKILSATTRRDFAWVRVIALLELLAASMLSTSPGFFAFLGLFILCAIAAFASGEVLRSMAAGTQRTVARGAARMVPRRLAFLSGGLFAGILIMTAGLFFVLPRTARAAVQRFVPQRYHLPGFSNEISLGEIGEIKQRSSPVMHVRPFGDGVLPVLRWRGSALMNFDGRRWYNSPLPDEPLRVDHGVLSLREGRNTRVGRSLQYQVQLSEIASDTLFFAGNPQTITINLPILRRSSGGAIRVPRVPMSGLHYGVFAFLEEEHEGLLGPPTPLPEQVRRELLRTPPLDPRIFRLAREMSAGSATREEEARAIERHLRQDYGYTLELPSTEVADPLANFLFERKKGHCEYFASAMAVMLRTIGIPSRVATGFLGGVYNPVTGWQVIRASDAHSWVEAWIDGQGWTTFDPTPPDPNPASSGILSGMALMADAAGQFWQDWVLSYDLERQVVLAARIGQSSRRMRLDWFDGFGPQFDGAIGRVEDNAYWVVPASVLLIAPFLFGRRVKAWLAQRIRLRRVQRGEAQASDATLIYCRMLEILERRGLRKPPWATPAEFARTLPPSGFNPLVQQMTAAYNQCRFGGRGQAATEMVALLDLIERGGA